MDTGDLRALVTIEQKARKGTTTGGGDYLWTPLARVWANIRALAMQETLQAEALRGSQNLLITIRHRDDVDRTMRIVYGSRVFEIDGVVDPTGRREWLEIQARET